MATLNDDQQKAFIDVLDFIKDPSRKYHRVSGGAGTGKSFFISKIADDVLKHKGPNSRLHTVDITATTNKAAAVLANTIPHRATDISTIYSFMNLRVKENYSTGEQKCIPTPNWTVHDCHFIIVDEASMVNRVLFEYIDKGTTSDCKILFVGDKNQLAPVREKLSPVYANPYSESMLTIPMRNAEQPALMELCEQLVDTVKTGKFTRIKEVPGVIDFINGEQMIGILEREYLQEDPMKRVLAYTNAKVIGYNEYIRNLRGYDDNFSIGEIVSNNEAAEPIKGIRLYTDQLFKVIGTSKPYLNSTIVRGHDIPIVDLEIEDVETGVSFDVSRFQNAEDRIDVLKHYRKIKDWVKFYSIKNKYPDLRTIAASTTHKAQGSTMDSVIVDLADIGKSTDREQTARLQYVALSRPRKRLYIRGQLPERYFE